MKSPIPIYGGKHYMTKFLLPHIPKHEIYVEVFGGGAKLLLAKDISPTEVYNDIDSNLVNFFRVLRNKEQSERLIDMCKLTPYSREEFYEIRNDIDQTTDPIERAWKFFTVCRMAFAGRHKSPSWARCLTRPSRNMALHVSSYISAIQDLEPLHERLFSVLIEHQDFKKIIPSCDNKNAFFYLDPPYVHSSRKGKDRYKHEMSNEDHLELVEIILSAKGKFIISGYENEIYSKLEKYGWKKFNYQTISWAAARKKGEKKGEISKKQKREECIWKSPNALD